MTQLTPSTDPPPLGSIVLHRGTYRRVVMRLGDLNQLTKPRIAVMVALTTGVGFGLGIRAATIQQWLLIVRPLVNAVTQLVMNGSKVISGHFRAHLDPQIFFSIDAPG